MRDPGRDVRGGAVAVPVPGDPVPGTPAPGGSAILRSRGSGGAEKFLIGIVLVWFAVLVLFPLGAMVRGVIDSGLAESLRSLASPVAQHAFWLTLGITVVSVVVNTFFGVILALVLARQKFAGKLLLNGVVDLPFSLSPVVAGFMFIILFGPNGWLGKWFEAGGIRVIFALPGMILATIFVTVPFVAREVVPGPPGERDRAGGCRPDPRRERMADILADHDPVDPMGARLRRVSHRGASARRVRRGSHRERERHRKNADGHFVHPPGVRRFPLRRRLRGVSRSRRGVVSHAGDDGAHAEKSDRADGVRRRLILDLNGDPRYGYRPQRLEEIPGRKGKRRRTSRRRQRELRGAAGTPRRPCSARAGRGRARFSGSSRGSRRPIAARS